MNTSKNQSLQGSPAQPTTDAALTNLAVDVVNHYDDEQLWNEFFSAWMASGKPVKPGHSGARMAAELLAAEVLRLRQVLRLAGSDDHCGVCAVGHRLPSGKCDHCNNDIA